MRADDFRQGLGSAIEDLVEQMKLRCGIIAPTRVDHSKWIYIAEKMIARYSLAISSTHWQVHFHFHHHNRRITETKYISENNSHDFFPVGLLLQGTLSPGSR
jgi:hypothetical protein